MPNQDEADFIGDDLSKVKFDEQTIQITNDDSGEMRRVEVSDLTSQRDNDRLEYILTESIKNLFEQVLQDEIGKSLKPNDYTPESDVV